MGDAEPLETPLALWAASPAKLPALPFLAAGALDALALWLFAAHLSRPPIVPIVTLHLCALLPLLASRSLSGSEKALAVAFAFGLPAVGVPLAALALGTAGRIEVDAPLPDIAGLAEAPRVDELRRLGEALPCCEALLAGSSEERRAIIATLTRRADAEAVALLRWALGAPDADLAVDAALAIEEMTAAFEARLGESRAELEAAPSAELALVCAETVTQAIAAGLVDPALVPRLAHEARRHFRSASEGGPERSLAAAIGRARLELEVLRPDEALLCIDAALAAAGPDARPPELLVLREEAVLASHALPWEGPSALASYQHGGVLPPPLTARRRLGTGRAIVRGTGGVNVGPVQIPPLASTHKVRRDGR